MIKNLKCRVCGSDATVRGLLYRCASKTCQSVFWDKRAVKKRIRALPDDIKATLELLCKEASIPKVTANEFFVYFQYFKRNTLALYSHWSLYTFQRVVVFQYIIIRFCF
jgi:hypothetical protein